MKVAAAEGELEERVGGSRRDLEGGTAMNAFKIHCIHHEKSVDSISTYS